jgi:D-glycerate 3-kinase
MLATLSVQALEDWVKGDRPRGTGKANRSPASQQQLIEQTLADQTLAQVWQWTEASLKAQWDRLAQVGPTLLSHWQGQSCPWRTCWGFWMPWSGWLSQQSGAADHPWIQGVLGVQGAGKSTLGQVTQLLLEAQGLSCLSLSIDDFYLPWADRQRLRLSDPQLIWRGPPGTHDWALAEAVLADLKAGRATQVPRFDKSLHGGEGDRSHFESVEAASVILFDGWCLGCRPLPATTFEQPEGLPPLLHPPEARQFARSCNQQLVNYEPLWDSLDSLLVLRPQEYRYSLAWRQEAERRMQQEGKPGLSNGEIARFVAYFWTALHPELFLPPLEQTVAEWIVTLDDQRQVTEIMHQGMTGSS